MNWTVSSRIYGGQAYSATTLEDCSSAAVALNASAESWRMLATSWSSAQLTLQTLRLSAPLCPALSSGTTTVGQDGTVHETVPYVRLSEWCGTQSYDCTSIADCLTEMSDLLVRAYSLYSEAELLTQRLINEVIQVATLLCPQQTLVATGAVALGGVIGGSIAENEINGIYALSSTAWEHEGLISGLASLIAGVSPVDGVLATDEVNDAAFLISNVTAPIYALFQSTKLTVRQVEARTEVVGEAHSVAEALENLRRLGEERLGKIDLNSGLSYGTIAIQEYRAADGSSSWLVTIPGTDGKYDSPFGWPQNIELMSSFAHRRMQAGSARLVAEAMERAGVGADDPVALIGHSQGGIVAATIASDMKDDYNIQHVITAGSPVANHPIPSSTWVTSVEIDDELVAALDGSPNPATDTWLTIRGQVHKDSDGSLTPSVNADGSCTPGTGGGVQSMFSEASVKDATGSKEISHWLKYHQAAYQNATDLGSAAVQQHEEHFQQILDGELVSTTYWQGRMTPGTTVAPGESLDVDTIGLS